MNQKNKQHWVLAKTKFVLYSGAVLFTTIAPEAMAAGAANHQELADITSFLLDAGTGDFAQAVAVTAGTIGMLMGAFMGKPMIAVGGVGIGLAGFFNKEVADNFFSAVI